MWEPISDAGKARERALCHQAFPSSYIIYVAESGPFENLTNVPERKPPQLQITHDGLQMTEQLAHSSETVSYPWAVTHIGLHIK